MKVEDLSKLIQDRKTTYAFDFSDKRLSKETIETIVTNALWAPTHKLTQPWRFMVLEGEHPKALGHFMADFYRQKYTEDEFSKERYESTKTYPEHATLLAVVFQKSKRIQLPEWEELAAISCAVQNMWLTCTAMGIGGYWDTAEATIAYGEGLNLEDNEQFLGIFYMGYKKEGIQEGNRKRKPLSKKLTWIE